MNAVLEDEEPKPVEPKVLQRDDPEPVDDSLATQILADQEKRDRDLESAVKKLAKFGITEDEARAIIGR